MTDYDDEYDDDVEYYAVRPNKTRIKQEIAVLFALAEAMSKLSYANLASLELPEAIFKSIGDAAGMPQTGARKRLLKFVAGQLHKMDITPIQERLARIQSKSAHAVREHHIVEHWRDRLIQEDKRALAELIEQHPAADTQKIRQLLRQIKKETELSHPPKSSRQLYQYLKALFKFEENQVEDGKDNGLGSVDN